MKNLIEKFDNKSGVIRLDEAVYKEKMDILLKEISTIFGASAADEGEYTGELTNCMDNAVDELEIVIHSPGGSVFDGYTLYNEILDMRGRGVKVTATINSLAASMASVIAMAADTIRMVPTGQMMIHDVSMGIRGNAGDLTKAAKQCDEMSAQIAEIYSKRTGIGIDEVRASMKEETWMTADAALATGYIDEIFDIGATQDTTKLNMKLLATLFPDKADEIAKFEAQVAENDTLRADLETAEAKIAELTNLSQVVADKETEIINLSAEVSDLKEDVKDLAGKLAESVESAPKQAVAMLAQVGQPEPLAETDEGKVSHLKAWGEIADPAKSNAYFKEHQAAIKAESRA